MSNSNSNNKGMFYMVLSLEYWLKKLIITIENKTEIDYT